MDYFCRIVVRIWWAKSTCSFDYIFLYSCCWKVCSKRRASHSGLAAEMRLLRDVNIKPRNLLWQPGLKYIRPFFFLHFKGLLHSCKMAGTFASPVGIPNSRLSGNILTREATTTSVQVAWESKAGCCPVCFSLSTAACGRDHCFRHSQRPLLAPASSEVWCELLFTETGSSDHCSQDRYSSVVQAIFFFLSPPHPALAQAMAAASLVVKHEKRKIQFDPAFGRSQDSVRWFRGEGMLLFPLQQTAHLSTI